jgi:hypothetical protein
MKVDGILSLRSAETCSPISAFSGQITTLVPSFKDGGQLKAQGLPETGRADHEHGMSVQSRLDHRQLPVTETI